MSPKPAEHRIWPKRIAATCTVAAVFVVIWTLRSTITNVPHSMTDHAGSDVHAPKIIKTDSSPASEQADVSRTDDPVQGVPSERDWAAEFARRDQAVASVIEDAIRQMDYQDAEITVGCVGHLVYLTGKVGRLGDADLAESLARTLSDRRTIVNLLAGPKYSDNQAIANQVAKSIRLVGLREYDIDITCKEGIATLRGTVSREMDRAATERAAMQVGGVKRVDNLLKVSDGKGQRFVDNQPTNMCTLLTAPFFLNLQLGLNCLCLPNATVAVGNEAGSHNESIRSQVASEIVGALAENGSKTWVIFVTFADGTASLSGTVESEEMRRTAERAAGSVPGVTKVTSNFGIGPAQFTVEPLHR